MSRPSRRAARPSTSGPHLGGRGGSPPLDATAAEQAEAIADILWASMYGEEADEEVSGERWGGYMVYLIPMSTATEPCSSCGKFTAHTEGPTPDSHIAYWWDDTKSHPKPLDEAFVPNSVVLGDDGWKKRIRGCWSCGAVEVLE